MSGQPRKPWSVESYGTSFVIDADGVTVAQVEDDADAEFIVRACNSHDDMLEALEAQEAAEKWIAENDDSDPFFEATYTLMLQGSRLLRRAAIAKATGASQD